MANISPARRKRLEREKVRNASGNTAYYRTKDLTKDVIRLLPLRDDEDVATRVVYYFINRQSYVCNESTHGKPGVIARTVRALRQLGTDEALELADGLDDNRRSKYLMKIVSRATADQPQWFESPKAIYDVMFNAFYEDGEDISDPDTGRDVRISKTGSGLNTEYAARILDECPLSKSKKTRKALIEAAQEMDLDAEIRADEQGALEALEDIVPTKIWRKIRKNVIVDDDEADDEVGGGEDDDDDDLGADEEDEPPKRSRKSKGKKRDPEPDDDDDDDEEDDDEDEDEDEDDLDDDDLDDPGPDDDDEGADETASAEPDDDDDEEDDDDDEEEEERPRKRRSGKAAKKGKSGKRRYEVD